MSGKHVKLTGIALVFVLTVTVVLLINSNIANESEIGTTRDGKEITDNIKFPPQLGGLNLEQSVSGPEAIGMISQLHGTGITIKQGYIASYGGKKIMIWVSESENPDEAKQLFDIMDRKIIEANTSQQNSPGQDAAQNLEQNTGPPFTDRRPMLENGINVIAVKGMGMENYYYRTGSLVFWIAVQGSQPERVLEEVMNKLSPK